MSSSENEDSSLQNTLDSIRKRNERIYQENKSKYHNRCEKIISSIFNENDRVKFIIKAMETLGCSVKRSFIKCRECPFKAGGFYDPNIGIIICENTLFNKRSIEDTLKHELIHSYDYCRANVDTDNCLHTSCAEIRAVNLSGECNFSREIGRMNFSILNHYKDCVKRRAEETLKLHTHCKENSSKYINETFETCYRDTDPFKFMP